MRKDREEEEQRDQATASPTLTVSNAATAPLLSLVCSMRPRPGSSPGGGCACGASHLFIYLFWVYEKIIQETLFQSDPYAV